MRSGWRETSLSSTYCCEESKLKFRFETSHRATILDQFDQECNSQGYEGYKVSVNYVYNIIGLLLC